MEEYEQKIHRLEQQLSDLKEDLFLCKTDLEKSRTQNIALKGFIQNLYESCEGVEETELELIQVVSNLKRNISVLARDSNIRL